MGKTKVGTVFGVEIQSHDGIKFLNAVVVNISKNSVASARFVADNQWDTVHASAKQREGSNAGS
jgi:hypothetical protein